MSEGDGISTAIDTLNPFKKTDAPAKPRATRQPRQPKAKTPGPKKDLKDGLAMAWTLAGGAIAMNAQRAYMENPPREPMFGAMTGRIMQLQGPVAGTELNKMVKQHDLLYRMLSPIFGAQEITTLTKVIGPPLLVAVLEKRPDLYPMLRPMLVPMLWEMFREMKKEEVKQEEIMKELTEGSEGVAEFNEFLAAMGFGEQMPEPAEPEPAVP